MLHLPYVQSQQKKLEQGVKYIQGVKYVFSAKIWFVKTSTRIVKHESRVVRSTPDCLTASKGKPIEKIWGGGGGAGQIGSA